MLIVFREWSVNVLCAPFITVYSPTRSRAIPGECVIITTHHKQIAPLLYCPEEAQDVVVKVTVCSVVEVPHFVAVIL